MATIEELNSAIETLKYECLAHDECYGCPMFDNCHYRGIRDFQIIKGGDSDETY